MKHLVAANVSSSGAKLSEGKRIPFGWKAVPVGPGPISVTELNWDEGCSILTDQSRFRVSIASDSREEQMLEVFSLRSGRVFGWMDIRFASVFQTYELPLSLHDAWTAVKEGIGLRLVKGDEALWFFAPADGESDIEHELQPHLFIETVASSEAALRKSLQSQASLQQFGWMEGCVLDGLYELGMHDVIYKRLGRFLNDRDELVYEDPRSRPSDGRFYGIESLLPIAILAKLQPDHPVLGQAFDYMSSIMDEDGGIQDKGELTAEGNYTIAYSLACMAGALDRGDLGRIALEQLELRKRKLWHGGDLYLRFYQDGSRTFRNWGRAYVWYLLGIARTVGELKKNGRLAGEDEQVWRDAFLRAWEIAWSYRTEEGMWHCFLGEPETGLETSATAGIAAATASAVRAGFLPPSLLDELRKTRDVLYRFMTPDGLLAGTSQGNKGGEALQRGGYRILSQVTIGLTAQLCAQLKEQSRQ